MILGGVGICDGGDRGDGRRRAAVEGQRPVERHGRRHGRDPAVHLRHRCAVPVEGKPDPPQLTFPGTNGFEKCVDPASAYTATFTTTAGTVVVQLDAATQPGTVNNFVQLAGFGYYDGTKLFRTDPSIGIVQGGAPHTDSATDPGPGHHHRRGFRFHLPARAARHGLHAEPGQRRVAVLLHGHRRRPSSTRRAPTWCSAR
jgi:hypothetical protein